jgi:hypothetical protein
MQLHHPNAGWDAVSCQIEKELDSNFHWNNEHLGFVCHLNTWLWLPARLGATACDDPDGSLSPIACDGGEGFAVRLFQTCNGRSRPEQHQYKGGQKKSELLTPFRRPSLR